MRFDGTHDVHFAGFAVKFQGNGFIAMQQLHGLSVALQIQFTLDLFRAKVERKAQAMFGNHD